MKHKPNPIFKIDEVTLVLVVAIIAIIVSINSKIDSRNEAEKITDMLFDDHAISFANGGVIDENKLKEIETINYSDFKNVLKAKDDFCIYIEDENGKIILAKGSTKLSGDGLHCRE